MGGEEPGGYPFPPKLGQLDAVMSWPQPQPGSNDNTLLLHPTARQCPSTMMHATKACGPGEMHASEAEPEPAAVTHA